MLDMFLESPRASMTPSLQKSTTTKAIDCHPACAQPVSSEDAAPSAVHLEQEVLNMVLLIQLTTGRL